MSERKGVFGIGGGLCRAGFGGMGLGGGGFVWLGFGLWGEQTGGSECRGEGVFTGVFESWGIGDDGVGEGGLSLDLSMGPCDA